MWEFFTKIKNNIKPHLWFLLIIIAITMIHFSVLFTEKMPYHTANDTTIKGWQQSDNVFFYFPMLMRIHQEIQDGNYYPLWNKYTLAGSPLMADPEVPIYTLPVLFMSMGIDPYLSDNLGIMSHFLLAGIFMYILIYLITKSKEAALISALCYANGGYFVWDMIAGAYAFIQCMSVLPLVLICFYYIIFTEKYVVASLFSVLALVLASTFSPTVFVYFSIFAVTLFIYFLIISNKKSKMIKKYFIALLIIIPLVFGLVAYKAFPAKEYMSLSERGGAGISFSESQRGWAVEDLALIDPLISPKYIHDNQNFRDVYIGLVPFILICFALLFKFKNKWVIYLSILTLILVLASFGGNVFNMFYKFYPMMYNMRRPQRFLIIANLAANILVAFGYIAFYSKFGERINKYLSEKFKKITSFFKSITLNKSLMVGQKINYFNWTLLIVILLIVLNLVVPGLISHFGLNYVDMEKEVSQNKVMTYISQQPGVFRMHSWEMVGQEYGMEDFTQPLKLQHLYGFVTVWEIDYMNIFMSASFQNPARLWGMLNTKYVTAMTPINVSGLKFIQKFDDCPTCDPPKAAGPYLYENEEFLPRAYVTKNAVLIYGKDKKVTQQLNYWMILAKYFNPKNTVVITTHDPNDMNDPSFLSKFKAVFLTEMPPNEPALKIYEDNGGKVFPDVLKGETTIDILKVENILKSLNENSEYYPLEDYKEYIPKNSDEMEIRMKEPKSGFLVLSEKFSYYPGWYFISNGKELKVLKASDVLTAVPIDKDQNIDIYYMPDSFKNTRWISIISLLVTVGLIIYLGIVRKKSDIKR